MNFGFCWQLGQDDQKILVPSDLSNIQFPASFEMEAEMAQANLGSRLGDEPAFSNSQIRLSIALLRPLLSNVA